MNWDDETDNSWLDATLTEQPRVPGLTPRATKAKGLWSWRQDVRDQISQSLTGRTLKGSTRQRMSEAKLGRKFATEHRAQMSRVKLQPVQTPYGEFAGKKIFYKWVQDQGITGLNPPRKFHTHPDQYYIKKETL